MELVLVEVIIRAAELGYCFLSFCNLVEMLRENMHIGMVNKNKMV